MWAHFAAWFQPGEPPKAAKMRHSILPASRCGTLCSSMPKPKTERRLRSRIAARLPVSVRSGNENLESAGYTRDLSMSGVFLYTDSQIREGSELEMVLMLPPELTEGEKRWVCCQGAVVRVENADGKNGLGVAASIRTMQVLPEILP